MNTTGSLHVLNPSDPDFNAILEIDRTQFPRPWSRNDWQQLNWEHHLLYAWSNPQGMIGFILLSGLPGDDSVHLLKICVESSVRGSGQAYMFWKSCVEKLKNQEIKSIYLEVESPNQKAISFYLKVGFQTLRKIKSYYSDGTDAVTMQMII